MLNSRTQTRLLLPLLAILVATGCAGPNEPEPQAEEATKEATKELVQAIQPPADAQEVATAHITEDSLRAPIEYLASDALAGRGPATEGDRLTQEYLSETLEALGLEPGFGDSWMQPFDVVSVHSSAPETWSLTNQSGENLDLAWWDDYIASSGVQTDVAEVKESEIVFVGFGIEAPEYNWDDYKGVDVAGKTLLMLNNDPDWDEELFGGTRRLYYGRWTYKYEIAAAKGADAAIIIHTTPSAGYGYQVVQSSWTGPQFQLPAEGQAKAQIEAWVSEEAAGRLVSLGGHNLDDLLEAARQPDFKPIPLGLKHSLKLANKVERMETANVAGLLPGSDPQLSQEVLIYTAHHDHLGVGEANDDGDAIYNGALDNAAGVSQILAIASSFQALPEPPKRSILFLFVAAEEQGLLGSAYWARHPGIEPGLIAANINHDGANIWGRTKDVTLVGHGKSSLDRIVTGYAASQGREVLPDQFPDRGFFYRSDQFSLAKIGVPAIYMDTGTHFLDHDAEWGVTQIEDWEKVHYHQPSDELVDSWNFEGMIEDASLSFFCGNHIANQQELPSWNPGDEFEGARRAARAALAP